MKASRSAVMHLSSINVHCRHGLIYVVKGSVVKFILFLIFPPFLIEFSIEFSISLNNFIINIYNILNYSEYCTGILLTGWPLW